MDSPPLHATASPTGAVSKSPAGPSLTTDSAPSPSHFADSGLGTTGLHTPKHKSSHQVEANGTTRSPSKTTNSISSRLEQLAALAWEAEADDRLDDHTRTSVHSQLHAIEAQLEGRTRGNDQTSSSVDLSASASSTSSSIGTPAIEPPLSSLQPILDHLTTTMHSMRARLSESKHLHTLALSKLSTIAQSNVHLTTQLTSTRASHTSLSHANAALRMRIADLEATTAQQSVAVSAMTGAVAGLESYVASPRNGFMGDRANANNTPNSSARRQTVVRGTGRFRGKYPIAPQRRDSGDVNMNLDGAGGSDLQEGILAWVRGFRDVEAGWQEMGVDVHHRTPTRFGHGNGNATTEILDTPQTPTKHGRDEEEESVLLQGDKSGGSDIFGERREEQEEEFGEFMTVASTGGAG